MRRRRGVLAGLPLGSDPMTATSTSTMTGGMGRSMRVNVSLLQYLDTGRWFLSVYNDDLRPQEVTLVVTEAEGVSTTCPNDCSGHGSCYLGKCDCIDGYEGIDCSKSKYRCLYACLSVCRLFPPTGAVNPASAIAAATRANRRFDGLSASNFSVSPAAAQWHRQ